MGADKTAEESHRKFLQRGKFVTVFCVMSAPPLISAPPPLFQDLLVLSCCLIDGKEFFSHFIEISMRNQLHSSKNRSIGPVDKLSGT